MKWRRGVALVVGYWALVGIVVALVAFAPEAAFVLVGLGATGLLFWAGSAFP